MPFLKFIAPLRVKILVLFFYISPFDLRAEDAAMGAPLHEVANASRAFALTFLQDVDPKNAKVQRLPARQQELYQKYHSRVDRPNLLQFIKNTEHRWQEYPDQKECARASYLEKNVVYFSYVACRAKISTAADMMPEILRSAFVAVANPAEVKHADEFADTLTELWQNEFPDALAQAQTFSIQRPMIAGRWSCTLYKQDFQWTIEDRGFVRAKIPLTFPHQAGVLEFANSVALNSDKSLFQVQGLLNLKVPPPSRPNNIAALDQCLYTFQATMQREDLSAAHRLLRVAVSSSGEPLRTDTCVALGPVAFTLKCVLP